MKGMTRKPCPACHEEGLRPVDGVCRGCESLIEDGKRYRAEEQERIAGGEVVWRMTPESSGGFHYAFRGQDGERPQEAEHRRALGDAFGELVFALIRQPGKGLWRPRDAYEFPMVVERLRMGGFDSFKYQLFPTGIPELLNALDREISIVMPQCYALGYRKGSHLLGRLADGSASVAEFNEARTAVEKIEAAR